MWKLNVLVPKVFLVASLFFAGSTVNAQETGSLFKNVMHGCFLSTNDNLEVSCDARPSKGSRWELGPHDDGNSSDLYNVTYKCTLGVSRDSGNDQLACYGADALGNAHVGFNIKPIGKVFNLVSVRKRCAVYGNREEIPTCLGLEASQDQQWAMVTSNANPAPAPQAGGFRALARETCQAIETQRDGAPMTATFRVGPGVRGKVELVWADKKGNWQNYGWMSAGETKVINSFAEHQWIMRQGQVCAYARVTKGDTKFTFE